MAEDVRAMFERLKSREQEYTPALEGIHGSYRFDIEGTGHWYVAVEEGMVHVYEENRDADCVIECSEEDFVRIVRGEQNLVTALLQGRVNITGDMALAQKFHGLIRAASRRPAAAGSR